MKKIIMQRIQDMTQKRFLYFMAIMSAIILSFFGQAFSASGHYRDIIVELSFFSQAYYLNDSIELSINVINPTDSEITFYVSSLIDETFFIKVRTPQNRELYLKNKFQVMRRQNVSEAGDYRKITLMPKETFSKTISIDQWYDFKESGYYYVQGIFYPNPDLRGDSVNSVNYRILVKPPEIVEDEMEMEIQERNRYLEKLKEMPPYKVIADLLDAKIKKDWERFFIHIDEERLIQSFTEFKNAYENAYTAQRRLEIIEEFKKYLTIHWQDQILSYKIRKTYMEDNQAEVTCDVKYKIRKYDYTLRYTFYLYKNHNDQWLLRDYTALKIQ